MSLLIALLRASNIPARYVKGIIRFDTDPRLLHWLGAKDYPGANPILGQGFFFRGFIGNIIDMTMPYAARRVAIRGDAGRPHTGRFRHHPSVHCDHE